MTFDSASPLLPLLIAAVACAYASVGHGGASGYLAVLSLSALAPKSIAATALVLNLVVASIAFFAFRQAKCFSWRLTWPFLLGAAPFALLGSLLKLSERTYFLLVGGVVLWASLRLLFSASGRRGQPPSTSPPGILVGILVGAVIGLLSGMVGVGGGIFLSPVLVLACWADAKQASATSAMFIVSNSLIGLTARAREGLQLPDQIVWLAIGAAAGATLGSWIGAKKMPVEWLRRLLGAVLLLAALKLLLRN